MASHNGEGPRDSRGWAPGDDIVRSIRQGQVWPNQVAPDPRLDGRGLVCDFSCRHFCNDNEDSGT